MSLPANVEVRSLLPADYEGFTLRDDRAMRQLSSAEDRHFWFHSRNRFIAERLARLQVAPPARILELGCGGGCVTAHLARMGYEVTGVDGHLPRVIEAAERAPTARFIVDDLARERVLDDQPWFDAVGLFDVIEHLDDPRRVLALGLRLARPGGLVVGTVPALMGLWSDADEHAGHRLRYGLSGLEAMARTISKCELIEVVPFNRLLVPLIWLQRRVVHLAESAVTAEPFLRTPWAPLNRGLDLALCLESGLADRLPRQIPGASLWFALRRPGDGGGG